MGMGCFFLLMVSLTCNTNKSCFLDIPAILDTPSRASIICWNNERSLVLLFEMLQINDFTHNFCFHCYRVFSSSMFWTTTRHDQKVKTNSNPFHEISLSNVTFAPFSCRVYVKTFQYLIRYNSILVLVFQCERAAVHFQATSVDKSILRDIIYCWVWKMKATYYMNW